MKNLLLSGYSVFRFFLASTCDEIIAVRSMMLDDQDVEHLLMY
jgi:hypothetical protein